MHSPSRATGQFVPRWIQVALSLLILLAGTFPVRSATTVNLDIRYVVEDPNIPTVSIVANPFLYSDVPLTSFHRVESPLGNHSGQVGTNVSASSSLHRNIPSLLNALTNGTWKLYFNKDHASEELFEFNLSIDNLNSNDFPVVTITSPTNNQQNIPTSPTITWTGPTDWNGLQTSSRTVQYTDFQGQLLPASATSWIPLQPMTEGSNVVRITYSTNNWEGIAATTPTTLGGTTLDGWSLTNRINVGAENLFRVGIPGTGSGTTLIAHYAFASAGTVTLDRSDNENHITSINSLSGSGPPVFTPDAVHGEGSVQFDGRNWYSLPDPVRDAVQFSFSASLWLKSSQLFGNDADPGYDGAGILAGDVNGELSSSTIPMALTGSKLAAFFGNDDSTLHSAQSVNIGEFVHVVVTRAQPDGAQQIYINGNLDSAMSGTGGTLDGISELALGINPSSFDGFIGQLDDVQIYQGILSGPQVEFLFNNPGTVIPDASTEPTLANAVDALELTWNTYGNLPWEYQVDETYDGEDAAASGDFGDPYGYYEYGGVSILETTIVGPGTLTFQWKIHSESGQSYLDFFSDDFSFGIGGYGGEYGYYDWIQESLDISAGEQTVTWEFNYQPESYFGPYAPSYYYGPEQGFLDQVVFTPRVVTPVRLMDPRHEDLEFSFSFESQPGVSHRIQSKTDLSQPNWSDNGSVPGNGNLFRLRFSTTNAPTRFFRISSE